MPTHDPQTVLLPLNLGSVKNYNPTAPLARVTGKDSLEAGCLYLRATLDEMIKIRSMSKSLPDNRDLLRETRAQYDDLLRQQAELELFEKRNWLYKLFKPKLKLARRAFANDAHELWDSTMTTSDKLKRSLLSTRSADLAPVQSESITQDEPVSGLAVDMGGPLTQEALDTVQEAAFILASVNPFATPITPDDQDGETSTTGTTLVTEASSSARSSISTSPTSPGSTTSFSCLNLNLNLNYNVVNNIDSTTPDLTINNNGSGNRGSDHRSPVNSSLS